MLSILITAFREEKTIGKLIESLLRSDYSGLGKHQLDREWEILIIAPDQGTRDKSVETLSKLNITEPNYRIFRDQGKGKPVALNILLKEAKGDYLLLTDGDVLFGEKAVFEIIAKAEDLIARKDYNFGGLSARPVGHLPKINMFNYWGALLADAAHHKRKIDLTDETAGLSQKLIRKRKFFPLSGYGMLVKNIGIEVPDDCLVDDAYISYLLNNQGYRLGYAPDAKILVKYPTNLSDYLKQKKRSTGGYIQLWEYGVVKAETKSRSFWREAEYFWFPLKYAKSLRELFWSFVLYPVRVYMWALIFWERRVTKKNFSKTWVRVESTK